MDGCETTFDPPSSPSFWALSDAELALACHVMAQKGFADPGADIRLEAGRLLLLWREALETPGHIGEDRARRLWLSSGLRKRTIQVLVRLNTQSRPPTLGC